MSCKFPTRRTRCLVPDENFDEAVENDSDDNIEEDPPILNNELIMQHIVNRINRKNRNIEITPTPFEIRPNLLNLIINLYKYNPGRMLFNIMNNLNNDSSEIFDPDLDEAIRRSLED